MAQEPRVFDCPACSGKGETCREVHMEDGTSISFDWCWVCAGSGKVVDDPPHTGLKPMKFK